MSAMPRAPDAVASMATVGPLLPPGRAAGAVPDGAKQWRSLCTSAIRRSRPAICPRKPLAK